MAREKIVGSALTYDDVLLVPAESSVLPRDTDVSSKFSRNIEIRIPLVSAAMDTVTESQLAIAIAREGGIGILHKNMPIEQQADEVDRVKRSESGMIKDPITLKADDPVAKALEVMRKYSISGIPIVNDSGMLVGILTNRDLRFGAKADLPISQIMTSDRLVTAPIGTTLDEAEAILQKHRIEKLPVVDKNGKLKGLLTFKDIQKKKKHPDACKDKHGRLRVGAAVGVTFDTPERVHALIGAGVDVVVVDTAHGHSISVIAMVKRLKSKFDIDIVAGNIGTAEGAAALIKAGADAIKIGIGPGSICTTRVVTGVGVPQVTAIMEAAKVAARNKVPVIADGGVKETGDVAKAIASGADSVMIGGFFAGVEESPGEKILYEGRSYKMYRGMGSISAMQTGSKDRYFQDVEDDIRKLVPEGIEGRVPYKGNLSDVVYQLVGGLRSAMGYCGTRTIKEMKEKSQFMRMTSAGLRESHPHDVIITKEAPNYRT